MDSEGSTIPPQRRSRLLTMVGMLAALSPVERAQRLGAGAPPKARSEWTNMQRARRKAQRKQAERSRRAGSLPAGRGKRLAQRKRSRGR